jgi:hypothetical protein
MGIKHTRVSTVSDDLAQPTLIQPSDWNDDHVIDDPAAVRAELELGALSALDTVATSNLNDHAVTYVKIQNISATDKLLGRSTAGAGTVEEIALTAAGRALIDDASAANQRTTLGLGTAALLDSDTDTTLAADSDTKVATQKAAKAYIDSKVAGLSWKQAVRAATTVPGTLASSFENTDTIDGVVLVTGDRILIKNQATGSENGIYVVNASGAPTRATDADSGAELVNATTYISEGTANADTQWTCTTNAAISIGSTSIAFAQLTAGTATTLDGLSDVVITSPVDGDVATYDAGSNSWKNKPVVGLSSRDTFTKTTGSLANNTSEDGTVQLAKTCVLLQLIVDRACRIVYYSTPAARTADSGRVLGVPPSPGLGILAEFAPTGAVTIDCGPLILLANGDGSPSTDIYYTITNMGGSTHTVQVDHLFLKLES